MSGRRRHYGSSNVLEIATPVHCAFAFDTLIAQLNAHALPSPTFPDVSTALFVTWKLHSTRECLEHHPSLRGCIGTLEPRQLQRALKDYALTSALRDTRFHPIGTKEIPFLQVTVSLLSCFEPAQSWQDWDVGKHGLIIEFTDPATGTYRTATFLPEVAPEQGWDHKHCIHALVKKSGFSGHINSSLLDSLSTTRYQSHTHTLSYPEYQTFKASLATASAVSSLTTAAVTAEANAEVRGKKGEVPVFSPT